MTERYISNELMFLILIFFLYFFIFIVFYAMMIISDLCAIKLFYPNYNTNEIVAS